MSRNVAFLLASIAFTATAAAPASAQQRVRIEQVVVSYADLDLTSAEGARKMTFRLRSAVDQVCGRAATSASMTLRRSIVACRQTAMDVAVAEINVPLLTGQYENGESARFARL